MRVRRCLNCNDYLDQHTLEEYCSRECHLEALYDRELTCKSCHGSGQGAENANGEWTECRRCLGTGILVKVK
jgi:DnaJ-class molecular chaperone